MSDEVKPVDLPDPAKIQQALRDTPDRIIVGKVYPGTIKHTLNEGR